MSNMQPKTQQTTVVTPLRNAVLIVLAPMLVGPVILLIGTLMGGDLFDGFFAGARSNSDLEDTLFSIGGKVSALGGLAGIICSLYFAAKYARLNKQFIFLAIAAIIAPFGLLFASAVINISVAYCVEYPSDCIEIGG